MFLPKQALLITLVLFLLFPAAMAQSISFADPGTTTHKDVYMYYANGTLFGQWNTTSTGIAIPNDTDGDVLLVLKPQYSAAWDEPDVMLANGFAFVQTNWIVLVVITVLLGMMFRKV
jgi:hypothetical protein